MNVEPVPAVALVGASPSDGARVAVSQTFGAALADALRCADDAVRAADDRAAALAAGSGSIVDASIARAKADVALDVVSVAASRVSGAVESLLQTQV